MIDFNIGDLFIDMYEDGKPVRGVVVRLMKDYHGRPNIQVRWDNYGVCQCSVSDFIKEIQSFGYEHYPIKK